MKEFFKGFFAIGEQKISALIVAFIITLGFALYIYAHEKIIDVNMTNLLLGFIVAISGINLPSSIGAVVTSIQQYKDTNTTNSSNK